MRAIKDDRARWRVHVESTSWADRPLAEVSRSVAREWLAELSAKTSSNPTHKTRKPLSALTVRNVLNLARRAFGDAAEEGFIDANPFAGLRVKRSRTARTADPWTVLTPDEQAAIVAALRDAGSRALVMFALGTGLRQGEQWALRLADVHAEGSDPYVLVRYGATPAKPTKGGRPRRVPLFGMALDAVRMWLPIVAELENPHGLLFPGRGGGFRAKGRPLGRAWETIVEKLSARPVRWHDLRHTCASSLVAGWWGHAWSLEEVCALLGHSSIKVTERYAHWADDALTRAARRMGPRDDEGRGGGPEASARVCEAPSEARAGARLACGRSRQGSSAGSRDPVGRGDDRRHERDEEKGRSEKMNTTTTVDTAPGPFQKSLRSSEPGIASRRETARANELARSNEALQVALATERGRADRAEALLRSFEATAAKFQRERDEVGRELARARGGVARVEVPATLFAKGDRVFVPSVRGDAGEVVTVRRAMLAVRWPNGQTVEVLHEDCAPALSVVERVGVVERAGVGEPDDDDEDEPSARDEGALLAEYREQARAFLTGAGLTHWGDDEIAERLAREFLDVDREASVVAEAIAAGECYAWADKARGVLSAIAEAMIKGHACLETRKAVRP